MNRLVNFLFEKVAERMLDCHPERVEQMNPGCKARDQQKIVGPIHKGLNCLLFNPFRVGFSRAMPCIPGFAPRAVVCDPFRILRVELFRLMARIPGSAPRAVLSSPFRISSRRYPFGRSHIGLGPIFFSRPRRARSLIRVLIVLPLLTPVYAKTDYKKWLQEEVVWIISQKERARFAALKSDDEREAFIREFWERRDPTPSTPRNECKEEHYRRYAHALKNFQEGTPGWKTDRGRVYIIHGAPDRENFVASQARLDLGGLSDIRSRMPNTIIWSYHSNPNGKYYRGELNLLFQPSTGLTKQNFALGESSAAQERAEELNRLFGPTTDQNWLEGDVRYRLVVAGPPSIVNTRGADLPTTGIGESAKYIEDLFRSPGDVLEENLERQAGIEKAKRQMREAVTARLGFGSLPLLLSSRSFARPDGNYRVHVQVDIPCSDLAAGLPESSQGKDTSQVDIYCALVDSEGHVTDESIESMEMSRSLIATLPGDNLHYLNAFTVPAGTYTLKAAIRSSEDRRLGFCEQGVLTTPSARDAVALSELLVTNRMQATGVPEAPESEAGITLGDGRFAPHPSRRFLSSDSLFVYFQIYLPEGRELKDTDLSIGIQFIRDNTIASRLETREITDPQSTLPGVVNFGTAVPLADFAPGEYTIQVQAIDHTTKRFAFQRSSFFVEESRTSADAGR